MGNFPAPEVSLNGRAQILVKERVNGKMPECLSRSSQDEHQQRMQLKLTRELGEQILGLLEDPRTEDILLNPDTSLWIKRMGEGFTRIGEMAPTLASSALSTIAAWRGTILNHQNPILETELPIDGSRFEGIVSPVVRSPVFAIRLRPRKIFTLDEYEQSGILTTRDDPTNRLRRRHDFASSVRGVNHAEIIRAAVRARKNILVVGSTGSGKTTFVNACLDALAQLTPNDRVITIEDTIELQCAVKNYLDLRAVGNVINARLPSCLYASEADAHCRRRGARRRGAHAFESVEHRPPWRDGHGSRQRRHERADSPRKPRRRSDVCAAADPHRRSR